MGLEPVRRQIRAGRWCSAHVHAVAICLALPGSLSAGTPVSTQQIGCRDLTILLDSANADFAAIRGELISSIVSGVSPLRSGAGRDMPESAAHDEAAKEFAKRVLSTEFERHLYATTRPLAGAESCEIRLMIKQDPRSALRQAAYRCHWSSDQGFADLKQSLASCLTGAAAREEAPGSFRLDLEPVPFDGGERSVLVSVEAGVTQGVGLSITHSVCHARSPGGCLGPDGGAGDAQDDGVQETTIDPGNH